jgi:hypothetical protein
LHEAVRTPIDPDVLEGGDLPVDAVESKIVPGKLVAGVRDLSLVGEVVADALDLVESLLVACIARIEKRVLIREWSARK